MIIYLAGESAIEKSIIYTSLSILAPENVKILSSLSLDDIKLEDLKPNTERVVTVVLKSPEDLKELELSANRTKLKRLIKSDLVKIIAFPDVHNVPESKTDEYQNLKKHKIPMDESCFQEERIFDVSSRFAKLLGDLGVDLP